MLERHLAILDAALPALVGAVIIVGDTVHGGSSTHPAAIALGVGAAAALAARRHRPGWTLVVSGAFVVVLLHLDAAAAAVAVLAPAVALYYLALHRGRRQQAAAAILAVCAVIAADVSHSGRPTIGQTVLHLLFIAVPLLAAEVIRTHQANLRLLVERFTLAEQARERDAERRAEQERIRIARELHDVLAHTLTEINVTASGAAERNRPEESRAALERIEHRSHAAIVELRGILGVLRDPDTSRSTPAPRTPAPGIDDVPDLITAARTGGMNVRLDSHRASGHALSEAVSLAAYRVVQESLTNARRHAVAARTVVTIRYDTTRLCITVDSEPGRDVVGASAAANTTPGPAVVTTNVVDGSGGVGIIGMGERVTAAGGTFIAAPSRDGFRVRAELPYGSPRDRA